MYRKSSLFVFIFALLGFVAFARATDYTSTNFINRDPIVNVSGGKSTSTNFQLYTSGGEMVIGQSSSTNFIGRAGFLYFSSVSTPVIAATAGDASVALSWSSAVGSLGINVTTYEVGQATVSGGPYTYTNVGSVLSSTRSSLTNGATYYFVVRALDFYSNPVVTSTQASAAPVAVAVTPPASSGGGGGGGGGSAAVQTTVVFSGRAYPGSTVTLLKDAQVVATSISGSDANFQITLTNLTAGNYIFSLYSEDSKGNRSSLLTFPVSVTTGATTNVSGIFLAPTIAVDKSEVKKGDNIAIFGQSTPNAQIIISVNSANEIFVTTDVDRNGVYLYNLDSSPLEYGSHLAKSKASLAAINGGISGYSASVAFQVSNQNVSKPTEKVCAQKGDVNDNCRVNLVDFSIMAYWFGRPNPPTSVDLNHDGKVNLVDLSIMAYYWTG
mgnify:FL=1